MPPKREYATRKRTHTSTQVKQESASSDEGNSKALPQNKRVKSEEKQVKLKQEPVAPQLKHALVWFRSDLRSKDNRALFNASKAVFGYPPRRDDPERGVIGLFVLSPDEWKSHQYGVPKVDFIIRNVVHLRNTLQEKYKIPLLVVTAPPTTKRNFRRVVAKLVHDKAVELKVQAVFYNKEYELDERQRDEMFGHMCEDSKIPVVSLHDQCGVPPGTLFSGSGNPYKVYTPFKNLWFKTVKASLGKPDDYLKLAGDPIVQTDKFLTAHKSSQPVPQIGALRNYDKDARSFFALQNIRKLWKAGEAQASKSLQAWAANKVKAYDDKRNFPSLSQTSALSPYLSVGSVSVRQCIAEVQKHNSNRLNTGANGITVWIQELIWRDFYRCVAFHFDHVVKNKPFKDEGTKIKWRKSDEEFKRWCEGKTGYPIVDAGMRQLLETGWMHNRVRMVVAMFLTKHLLIDWKRGEEHFMKHLVDGDFCSNNGGWQWAASTGTDAQPYFRIFAPTTQGERFDKHGEYIQRYVPELKGLDSSSIHEPSRHLSAKEFEQRKYVKPIVEHKFARERALEVFKTAFAKKK